MYDGENGELWAPHVGIDEAWTSNNWLDGVLVSCIGHGNVWIPKNGHGYSLTSHVGSQGEFGSHVGSWESLESHVKLGGMSSAMEQRLHLLLLTHDLLEIVASTFSRRLPYAYTPMFSKDNNLALDEG